MKGNHNLWFSLTSLFACHHLSHDVITVECLMFPSAWITFPLLTAAQPTSYGHWFICILSVLKAVSSGIDRRPHKSQEVGILPERKASFYALRHSVSYVLKQKG